MDIILYFVLGAAVGSWIAARKIGNKAIFLGGFCALVPSVDAVVSLFLPTSQAIFVSGGYTHSIVFCALLAPIVGWLFHKICKFNSSIVRLSFLAFFCMISHCVIDVLSISGAGILEPFSHKRYALPVLADIDWFCLCVMSVVFLLAYIVRDGRHKSMISWSGIFIMAIYISFAFLNKLSVQSLFEQNLKDQDIRYSRAEVFPVSGSMLMWNCVAQDRDGFWMSYQSNFSKNNFELNLLLRNDYYLFEHESVTDIKNVEAYTKNYYIVESKSDSVVFIRDLRYARVGLRSTDEFRNSFEVNFLKQSVEIQQNNHYWVE